MKKLWQLKFIAFTIHLLFSAVIIGIFMVLVTRLWFPDILFSLENVWEGLQILIPVDAILGPLLTLILFVPGKKGLVGDIIIIGILQILALVYGGYTIYNQRPEVFVFAGNRFEIIVSSKFDRNNFAREYFKDIKISYPLLTYALPGQTEKEHSSFVLNNTQYQKMSERYRPITGYKEIISKKSLSLSRFFPVTEKSKQELINFKSRFNEQEVLLFVLEGTTSNAKILVLDSNNLEHIGYLDLDPWTEYKPQND